MTPQRLVQRRQKGFRLPLTAKSVARPSRFGNPWRVFAGPGYGWTVAGPKDDPWGEGALISGFTTERDAADVAVTLYRLWMTNGLRGNADPPDVTDLAGRDLACYCELSMPCHADVLLYLANEAVTL